MKTITKLIIFGAALWLCSACSRLDSDSRLFFRSSMSKGSAITTDNLNVNGKTLVANAYLEAYGCGWNPEAAADADCPRYIKDAIFTYNGTSEKWEASDCMWRNEVATNFWCYHPQTLAHGTRVLSLPIDKADDAAQKTMSFTYTMPTASAEGTDAQNTEDMVFAYARKEYYPGSGTQVNILFQHAISAIQFTNGEILEGYDIKSVTIKGFHTSGKCTLTGVPSEPMNSDDKITFAWSDLRGASSNTGLTQNVTLAQLKNNDMVSGDKVFMVIPQTLTEDAKVTVILTKGSREVEKTASLGGSAVTWLPEKRYRYKLNYKKEDHELTATLVDFNGESWNTHSSDGTSTGTFTGDNW